MVQLLMSVKSESFKNKDIMDIEHALCSEKDKNPPLGEAGRGREGGGGINAAGAG